MAKDDNSLSKKKLAQTALAEFAEHGLAGARTDRIAKRAGRNKQLLYYYFGSKEKLFSAVIDRAADRVTPSGVDRSVQAPDRLRRYLRALNQDLEQNPEETTLLLRAVSDPQALPRVKTLFANLERELAAIVSDGQGHGFFRDDVDPAIAARQATVLVFGHFGLERALPGPVDRRQWVESAIGAVVSSLTW